MSLPVRLREYRALAEIRYRIRRFVNFSEAEARAAGLEPQQHQLLLAIHGMPPSIEPTIGVIAERMQIVHHSAVELVNRSVERGLVRKQANARDRRQVFVQITARGHRLLEKLAASHKAELGAHAPALVEALRALVTHSPKALASGDTELKQ